MSNQFDKEIWYGAQPSWHFYAPLENHQEQIIFGLSSDLNVFPHKIIQESNLYLVNLIFKCLKLLSRVVTTLLGDVDFNFLVLR